MSRESHIDQGLPAVLEPASHQKLLKNGLTILTRVAYDDACAAGWWDTDRNEAECIALMHSELSEALEAIRKPGPSPKIPEFSALEEELADTLIRIADFAGRHGLNLGEAVIAKLRFNATRPPRHGGKKF